MIKSIAYFKFYRDTDGKLLKKYISKVYCVINGDTEIKTYDV